MGTQTRNTDTSSVVLYPKGYFHGHRQISRLRELCEERGMKKMVLRKRYESDVSILTYRLDCWSPVHEPVKSEYFLDVDVGRVNPFIRQWELCLKLSSSKEENQILGDLEKELRKVV